MSSLALMRWLEGSPERYDRGMSVLTFGRLSALHAAVAEEAVLEPGDRVLEVGCGTGAVTARLLARGARITAIDQSPEMLEQATARLGPDAASSVEWLEQTAAEVDRLPAESFDAAVFSLCLSEMSTGERAFVLSASARCLRPGGVLVAADEVWAPAGWRRNAQRLLRGPQALLGWLLVGAVSKPLRDLPGEIRESGLRPRRERQWLMGTLGLVVAERPA